MASISSDTFTVNTAEGLNQPIILYDHSRKHRRRRFFLYPPSGMTAFTVMAVKDPTGTTFANNSMSLVPLPKKMAFALWLAYQAWRSTQR